MKIVLVSDLHFDAHTAGYPRFDDVGVALTRAVSYAIEQGVDLFAFLGDLVDPDRGRAHDACAFAIEQAARLADAEIAQAWLTGNHDVIEDGSGTSTLEPLAAMFTSIPGLRGWVDARPSDTSFRGRQLIALPYVARSHAYDPAAFIESVVDHSDRNLAAPVIVLGHLMLPGIVPGTEATEMSRGRDIDYPIDAIQAKWGGRALMFGGHIHKRQVYRGVQVVGSAVRLAFDEEGNTPGFLVAEIPDA